MADFVLPKNLKQWVPGAVNGADRQRLAEKLRRPWAAYVHVPFCRIRCGYCDFNTYTKSFGPGAGPESYHHSVQTEITLAKRYLQALQSGPTKDRELKSESEYPPKPRPTEPNLAVGPIQSVYFGGGTPTLLSAAHLVEILAELRRQWGIAEGAEVSIEANPDTITRELVDTLATGGFTRVSIGMQSAVPEVLRTLDRTHRPERVGVAVKMVQEAGMQASLDLIYGTPQESLADWQRSLEAAITAEPDHISAYSLVIEPGTKMGRQLARGEITPIDPDEQAEKYQLADHFLAQAGYAWYEISNWAKMRGQQKTQLGTATLPDATSLPTVSRHNLAYWQDWNWWGFGPGAHSHLGGIRWWNRKHPLAYAQSVATGQLPIQDGEVVDSDGQKLEQLMLAIRTASGIIPEVKNGCDVGADTAGIDAIESEAAQLTAEIHKLIGEGLLERHPVDVKTGVPAEDSAGNRKALARYRLTGRGRLLADLVTLRLVEDPQLLSVRGGYEVNQSFDRA